ncbi:unnamed protein product [Scytosiphon promiscuus]
MISRIKEYFEDRGVTAADLPRAFVVHEFMSVAFLALTWAACYQIQPSQSPLFAPINRTVQRSNNAFIVKGRESFATLVSKSEKKISQEWLSKRGIDSGRVVFSLAESTLFRKLAKPVTIPAKLWLTLNFVQRTGGRRVVDGDREEDRSSRKGENGEGIARGRRAPAAATAGELSKGEKGASGGGDTIVTEREGGAEAKRPSSKAGGGLGWGGGRAKRRRKAICPPGSRGGAPGCFVAAIPAAAAAAAATAATATCFPLRAS